ncbi:hypothetical protein IFM12275_65040 [Nocardia sputorum]|nr:hypothetical protein IFM12275_65040 [Nocardia sputorum]
MVRLRDRVMTRTAVLVRMGIRRRELVAAARQTEAAIENPPARSRLDLTEMVRFCGRVYCGESSSHALAVHAIRAQRTIGSIDAAAMDTPFDRLRLESLDSVARDVEGLDADTVDLTRGPDSRGADAVLSAEKGVGTPDGGGSPDLPERGVRGRRTISGPVSRSAEYRRYEIVGRS